MFSQFSPRLRANCYCYLAVYTRNQVLFFDSYRSFFPPEGTGGKDNPVTFWEIRNVHPYQTLETHGVHGLAHHAMRHCPGYVKRMLYLDKWVVFRCLHK